MPPSRPIPHLKDLKAWQEIRDGADWHSRSNEDLASAFRAMNEETDKLVRSTISQRLEDEMERILRIEVGWNHPNQGFDIRAEVRNLMIDALLDPLSADGVGLCYAFHKRISDRVKDRMRARASENKAKVEIDPVLWTAWTKDPDGERLDRILYHVRAILAAMPPDRRRAILLLAVGMSGQEIAAMFGVTDRTIRNWHAAFERMVREWLRRDEEDE